jgi:hypothetical protein
VGKPCPYCEHEAQRRVRTKSWEQESLYDGLDLPHEEDEAWEKSGRRQSPTGIAWYWYGVALLLLAMMVGRVIYFR